MKPSMLCVALIFEVFMVSAALGEPMTFGRTESLWSEVLNEERPYAVALPAHHSSTAVRYPVVYLLGGPDLFHYMTGLVKILAHEDHVPPMILVGVEHTARTRDLTTPWTRPDPPVHMKRWIEQAGGADAFTEFLTQELAPHIEAHYRAAAFRIVIGRSLAGFFVLHTLFTSPDAFDGYIAISPSTHWNDGILVQEVDAFLRHESGALRHEPGALRHEPGASQKFLFLSIADEGGEGLDHYRQLVKRLEYDAPVHLHWAHRTLAEEDHGTAILPGLHRGLRTIFDGWRPPAFVQEKGLEGFDAHFARLSKRYGFDIPVPESTINVLGLRTLLLGRPAEAVAILTQSVERYPDSSYARYCLATALEEEGQLEKAVLQYERAIALGVASDDPGVSSYRQRLEALRDHLDKTST